MYKEKQMVSIVTSKKEDTGFWTVKFELVQSRKKEDGEWESKSIEANASSMSEESAFAQVQSEIMIYLHSVGGDLFTNPDIGKESEKWTKTPM